MGAAAQRSSTLAHGQGDNMEGLSGNAMERWTDGLAPAERLAGNS